MAMRNRSDVLFGLMTAVSLADPAPASAQTFTWNVNNGSFQNPNSWTPLGGPPGVGIGVTAAFAGPSSLTQYLATFDSDWALNSLSMNQGTTTFALNGHTLSVNNLSSLGNVASQTTTWNLSNGTLLTPGSFAYASGTNATLTLNLDHATFSANSYTDMASGTGSTFNLNVRNGSSYSALNNSFIGIVGTASVLVDGVGSSFSLGSSSRIGSGNGSSGAVVVQNGAAFNTVGSLSIGAQTGVTGVVTVQGSGSTWTHTDGTITLGGGSLGAINVNPSGTMNVVGNGVAAGIVINNNSTNTIAGVLTVTGIGQSGITMNGGSLTINTGGSVTTDYFTRPTGAAVLTINDGVMAVNKQFDLGTIPFTLSGNTATANPTLQFQNGATADGITTLTLGTAAGRQGTLKVLSGANATLLQTMTVGATGVGAVLVDGANSTLTSAQVGGTAIVIGQSGNGTMTVQNGGTYITGQNNSISIGVNAGSTGTLTVAGANSTTNAAGITIGHNGAGAMSVLNGGAVSTVGDVLVGDSASGNGSLTVSGTGATFSIGGSLNIGGSGASANNGSQLTIGNGGSLTAAPNLGSLVNLWNGSTLSITGGGSATFGGYTRNGTLNLNNGTLTVSKFFSNGDSPASLTVAGLNPGDVATLQLSGASSTSNITALTVGGTRTGQVNVMSGSNLSANSLNFASSSSGNGAISLSGPNSTLNVTGPITFGSNGVGALTIGNGSSVVANSLSLGSSGTVNLSGGALSVNLFTFNGGAFNWNNGSVTINNSVTLGSTELNTLLGPGGTLSAGRTLNGSPFSGSPLTIGANLTINGGSLNAADLVNQASLNVTAGTVQGTNSISNSAGAAITVANGAQVSGSTVNSGDIQLGGSAARLNGSLANSGRLSGSGTVTGNLSNNVNGQILVDSGQRMVFGGATNTNASNGTIQLTGGTLEFTGQLNNLANGLISGRGTFRGSTANVSGTGLVNAGAVAFSAGTSDVYGKVTNTTGGQIVAVGGGICTFHDDVIHNGAEIRTSSGARTVFLGAQSGAGNFTGTGTVEYQGDLRPGNSPASIAFGGDIVLGHSARLNIEIGGIVAGMNYDQLNVANAAAIDGTLAVALINGFMPVVGQRFDIMHFNSSQGNFGTFTGLDVGNGLMLQPGSDLHTYFLTVTPVPEPTTILLVGVVAAGGWCWRRRRVRDSDATIA
jgi:T5SS/PEP-CTERM-associated repeat protein